MNADDFKLLMDSVADVVAPVIEQNTVLSKRLDEIPAPEPHTELVKRVETLEAENKALLDLLKDVATQEDIEALVGTLNAVSNNLDALSERVDNESKAIIDIKTWQSDLDITGACDTLWDERWKHEVTSMIPEPPEPVDLTPIMEEVSGLKEALSEVAARTPPEPLAPTELQVAEGLRSMWGDVRQGMLKYLPKMEHKGVWDADTQYDVGDEVIRNGSTYRLMHKTDEAPPGEGWQMIAQGKKGSQGKPGPYIKAITLSPEKKLVFSMSNGDVKEVDASGLEGKNGVGIKDMVMPSGQMMVVEMTDGDIKEFDMSEFIDVIIKTMGE